MIIAQLLCPYDPMQIGLHQFLNQINFPKALQIWRPQNIEDADDIFVVKMSKQFNLAQGTEAEHRVVEGGYAFNGYAPLRGKMDRAAYYTIRPFANDI